jgi:8-amino-7-oxononanoate synthase
VTQDQTTSTPLEWIECAMASLQSDHLIRRLVNREGPQAATVLVNGESLINFGSNDYLALADHPEVRAAAEAAIAEYGWGGGASPLILGHSSAHAELQRRLAEREQTEAALVFPTGYAANVGTITALAGPGDLILSDAKNHASIIDGCRLSAATVQVYPHGEPAAVDDLISHSGDYRRILIVTDGLFSMDGDVAPLAELVSTATKYGAMVLVDEAHATGVLGPDGRGTCELAGVEHYAGLVRTGTLSKALGSLGGFAVGNRSLANWLTNRCRSYIFSTAAPAAVCAAAVAAIDVEQREPRRRRDLLQLASRLRAVLASDGWQTGRSQSQIIPILIGQVESTMDLSAALRQRGLFVPGIRPPSVPAGESQLRISLTYGHTSAMIEQLTRHLRELRRYGP